MVLVINRSVWPGDGDTDLFGQVMMIMVINRSVWPGNDGYGDKETCLARQ